MFDLTPSGRGRVLLGTFAGTLACIAIALFVDSFNFLHYDDVGRARAILINTLLPTFLAGPMLFYLLSKLRELALAHERLAVIAATDSLTGLLNRGAFLTGAETWLRGTDGTRPTTRGALLVIDADNFKAINDRFGHQYGDIALQMIADAIAAALRSGDRLGRIGGEEFGVLLPGAGGAEAEDVAERIRAAVRSLDFAPDGTAHPLTVSVGAVCCDGDTPFGDLFRVADQQLYRAKRDGRDRVALAPATEPPSRVAA